MAYLEELLAQQQYTQPAGGQVGLRKGQAYASFYNPIETTTPAYLAPNSYTLTQTGYRANEFAYSIMQLRASAKAQAPLRVMRDIINGDDEEMFNHKLTLFLHNPNPAPNMTWQLFMQMKQITQDIAGFSAWEIEYNNAGDVMALWYMTPYWCSFLRGQQQPLRAIRYQPWGLQAVDIPFKDERGRPKILFFSDGENFDPLTDRVRFYSPVQAAFPQLQVDNAMTFFLNDFVKHGAKFAGLISVAQTIDQTQADDYRRRWRAQHGGSENWADPLILGEGATYTTMQMNFKDMAFPDLDARTETRICNAFKISPIVAEARAGLDVSSYNNKVQAQKEWYYNWVIPSWRSDADSIGTQLLPIFEPNPSEYYAEFDISEVYALKEDRDAQVKRGVEMYKARLATLNEARKEVGLPPKDGGDEIAPEPQPFGSEPKQKDEATNDAKDAEAEKFRKFAKQRTKEGKRTEIGTFKFKYHDEAEQNSLMGEFDSAPKSELLVLAEAINKYAEKNVA